MAVAGKESTPLLDTSDVKPAQAKPRKYEDIHEQDEHTWGRVIIFLFLIFFRVVIHYDSGAIAAGLGSGCTHGGSHNCASESDIITDLNLSYTEAGLLVCLVYLGLTLSCTFGGVLLQRYSSKWLLVGTFNINLACILVFALSTNKYLSLGARFVTGLAQAFLVMFLPVWVDEYAPPRSSTSWMALAQIGSNVGIILGYIVSGLVTSQTNYDWRVPFWCQVAVLVPLILAFCSLEPRLVDISGSHRDDPPAQRKGNPLVQALEQFPAVFSQPVFVLSSGVLSVLYFVVAGMQVWITPFLSHPPFSEPVATIVFIYGTIASSAPALGLVMGGLILDRYGGYKDVKATVDIAMVFGLVGVAAAFAVMFADNLPVAACLVWVVLFCGGVVVPACIGLGLGSVDKQLRPTASSASLLVLNLFGWFAGPLVSGAVASFTGDVRWGFRTTMAWSSLSFVFLLLLRCVVGRRHAAPKEPSHEAI